MKRYEILAGVNVHEERPDGKLKRMNRTRDESRRIITVLMPLSSAEVIERRSSFDGGADSSLLSLPNDR